MTWNPLDHPIMFTMPRRLSSGSTWHEHIPFAMFLVDILRPEVIVELGTQHGDSYCAFCQAVKELGLQTLCYAIGTWQSAECGGPEVLADLRAHHDQLYGAFSRLIRSTYDKAVKYFSDGTVDILHIAGRHDYEAAKRIFVTWLPKISVQGVVLLDDINVREADFGVWKFWEEIKMQYSHFEFVHGGGLGILAVGKEQPEALQGLLNASEEDVSKVRSFFFELGRGLAQQVQQQRLSQQIEEKERVIQELEASKLELKMQQERLRQQAEEKGQALQALKEEFAGLKRHMTNVEKQNQTLTAELTQAREQLQKAQAYIDAVQSSVGWKVLEDVRRLYLRLFPRGTKRGRWFNLLLAAVRVWLDEGFTVLVRRVVVRIKMVLKSGIMRSIRHRPLRFRVVPSDRELQVPQIPIPPPLRRHSSTVDIIVCVHNALEYVKQCLESVVRYTHPPYLLILIDDGSNEETKAYLDGFARAQGALLIRNERPRGYTRAANQGLRLSQAEYVILLNSDTIVTPGWLDRMIACAESDPSIGLVGPLSNFASWQSIPEVLNPQLDDWAQNELPDGVTPVDMGELVAQYSGRIYPRVRFLNGFCLLIKRKVLEEIGLFDEETFGSGYGEENDYCLRAYKAGWQLAIADDAYVYHWGSRSFSHEQRLRLRDQADQALVVKHGQRIISEGIAECQYGRELLGIRARSRTMLPRQQLVREGRKLWNGRRVLFVLPILDPGGGGNVVFQEARAMREMGVDVRILHLLDYRQTFERNYPEGEIPIIYAEDIRQIPDIAAHFDAVIATTYESVYWLEALSFKPSPLVGYYVQDFEPYFFPQDPERFKVAWDSYTLYPNLIRLTKTEWNRSIVREKIGVDCHVVGPSVDIDLYRPRRRRAPDWPKRPLRICAMIRPITPRRNPELTMEVLREVYREYKDAIEIIIFGCRSDDPEFLKLPRNFRWRNAGILTRSQVASLLNEIDIFVDFSSHQAMGLTAMEAMACGAAVIVPSNGGARSFARHESNSLIVDTSSQVDCVDALQRLILDSELRQHLQRQGIFDMCDFPPEKAAFNILKTLFGTKTWGHSTRVSVVPQVRNTQKDELIPPPELRASVGPGDFKKIGEEFFRYFRTLCDLKPDERVLDVGCGVGRMAIPLLNYLEGNGEYEGFDIIKQNIDWCNQHISPMHPRFHFHWVNVFNKYYNPDGEILASEFTFPFGEEAFDFVFATSVFTHMLPQDMEHYFAEIRRVLKRGGRCLITFFLLNNESLNLIKQGRSTIDFKHGAGNYRWKDDKVPESAIAYDEEYIRSLYDKNKLRIKEPIRYGSWCGRSTFLSYQDIIIAEKV